MMSLGQEGRVNKPERFSVVPASPIELPPNAVPAFIICGVIGILQWRTLKPSTFPIERAHARNVYHI